MSVAQSHVSLEVTTADRRSVLLVDDDAEIRGVVELILEAEGYAVATAAEGEAALRHLRSGARPGVILLDLRMPGMDGRAFREAQRADPQLAAIPVVVFSGDRDAARVAGLLETEVLLKPVELDRLLTVVERYCGSRE